MNVTYDPPLFSIPNNANVSVYIDEGRVFGTCMNYLYNKTKVVMLNFTFSDVIGYGEIIYSKDFKGDPGITIQISTVDLNKLNVTIVQPKLPLPESFVEGLTKQLAVQIIPHLNNYFKTYPFLLPQNYVPYFPNPILYVKNIPSGEQGYVEIDSYCSCDVSEKYWIPCTSVPYCKQDFEKPSKNTELTKSETINLEKNLQKISNRVNGVVLQLFESADCSIDRLGDSETVVFLSETNGRCSYQNDTGFYYSLDLNSVNGSSLRFSCESSNCSECALYLKNWNDDSCIQTNGSSVYLRFSINQKIPSCIGPLVSNNKQESLYWVQYPNGNCAYPTPGSFDAYVIAIFHNIGKKFGNGTCMEGVDDVNYFQVINTNNQQSATYSVHLFCENSTCSQNFCSVNEQNLLPGVCIRNSQGYTSYFLAKSIGYCGPKTFKIQIVFGIIGCIALFALVGLIVIFRKKIQKNFQNKFSKNNDYTEISEKKVPKDYLKLFKNFLSENFELSDKRNVKRNSVIPSILVFLTYLPYIGLAVVYLKCSPFSVFSLEVLVELVRKHYFHNCYFYLNHFYFVFFLNQIREFL